jgi:hypothetical protein
MPMKVMIDSGPQSRHGRGGRASGGSRTSADPSTGSNDSIRVGERFKRLCVGR